MPTKERKKKPNTYRGYWGEGKELQCIVSVYHIFLNVSQHNLEQKHHSGGAGAATALRCSTQQQHSQSQSQRSAGLLPSSSVGIPPWCAAFVISEHQNEYQDWMELFSQYLNAKHTWFTHSAGGNTYGIPILDSQQGGNTAPKANWVFWTPIVHVFLQKKQA